ncbi:MFS general substrate transporter [Hortaea werneckii]|nr:MFS general substrate transporter [Hortaea werneckii]KAI6883978.1 MFS general substrate transporter [Hortaea werneckii]KAI6993138.1 MFS general substrate transporter [Hortaea werneckii]KAI7145357.1 MFS general substrate transporter [Hortaea werneckii]KAI7167158.1 MFS general substrate transporter [Hortaea werneckii]
MAGTAETDANTRRRTSMTSNPDENTPLLLVPETTGLESNRDQKPNGASTKSPAVSDSHGSDTGGEGQGEEAEEKPMPYRQILLLCYTAMTEPIAYFAIFPFMPEMIFRTGVPQSSVGFWTGIIESLFSLVQMVLMIFYGRAADKFGRKPVLIFSLAGMSVFTALFGMSQTLWQMILCRCLAGCFAGSVVTVRTMISENCTKQSQAKAFSWYMFTRNLGILIGPLIGGGLANPTKQFPHVFAPGTFFEKYCYALSTYVTGAVCLSATFTSLFGLKETLDTSDQSEAKSKSQLTTTEVLKSPGIPIVLLIFGYVMLMGLGYTAVNPVFLYTDVDLGGWGFSDQQIAGFLALAGASQSLWMLLAFPRLQKWLGTGNLLRVCAVAWAFMYAGNPLLNEVLRQGWQKAFWISWPIFLVLGSGVSMAYACVQLCLNDMSPSSTVLATVNALGLTLSSAVRAFAPVAFTSIYAAGVKGQILHGHLVWALLIVLTLGLNVLCFFLPREAEGRYKEPAQEAEGDGAERAT